MIHKVLRIGSWTVDFLFTVKRYDIDGILACLVNADEPKSILKEAEELMLSCKYNCGFTYTNSLRHEAVILIGPTSSGEEFIDSLVHEIHHLAVAIAADLDIDLESETPAYIAGDAARELAHVVCQLGCE